ncbi:hypothetical protein DCCM_2637 [Desulfocucumis palustris]|uniref:Uncharacterized protein n=1 Tax=Desulfocucumis palustris TaxID=1898651 RepID=A0A2L2XBE8_9FIRM|nr:hypothetical protein DCCM_2637 [Desulfocucumis palustris]
MNGRIAFVKGERRVAAGKKELMLKQSQLLLKNNFTRVFKCFVSRESDLNGIQYK